jgi:tripartite-type tricarboxylate transporter receptor subunit TctC
LPISSTPRTRAPVLFGASEIGSVTKLVCEMLKQATKADITLVPFTGRPEGSS